MKLSSSISLLSRLRIRDRDSNDMVPFRLNPNQSTLCRKLQKLEDEGRPLWYISLKARRVGVSAFTDGLLFTHSLATPGMRDLILAHERSSSEALFDIPLSLLASLPEMGLPRPTKTSITIPHNGNKSTLTIKTAGNFKAGRGFTLDACHLSEAAFYPGEAGEGESFASLMNAVAYKPGSILCIESTANGMDGPGRPFYQFWQDSTTGHTDLLPVFLTWLEDPACHRDEREAPDAPRDDDERELMQDYRADRSQIAWMRRTVATNCNGDALKFRREFPWCVDAGALTSTRERGIVPLRTVEAGEHSELGEVQFSETRNIKPVVAVRTYAGRELIVTGNHQIELAAGGFVEASRSIGESIKLQPPVFPETSVVLRKRGLCGSEWSLEVTPDLARFLGYFMGDGSMSGGGLSICCTRKDEDVVADVVRLTRMLLGEPYLRHPSEGSTEVRISRSGFLEIMDAMEIRKTGGGPTRWVRVPPAIFRSPKRQVTEFLRALFEADGFAGTAEGHFVSLFSKYLRFLREVQLLLLGLGITSRIAEHSKIVEARTFAGRKTYPASTHIGYELRMRIAEAQLFAREIGFIGARKQARCQSHLAVRKVHRNTLPITMSDRVTEVVPVGEREVWDIMVPGPQTFGAWGISVHNSASVAFLATGDPAFLPEELRYARSLVCPPRWRGRIEISGDRPEFHAFDRGSLLVWEKPQPRAEYFIGMDCAKGTDLGDYAAIVVWRADGEQVAAYEDRLAPELCAPLINALGIWYNEAMLNIELTGGYGRHAQVELRDKYGYWNLYGWKGRDDKRRTTRKTLTAGWETTVVTRELMFASFRKAIRSHTVKPHQESLVTQMEHVRMNDASRWTVEVGHDDVLCAGQFGWIARDQWSTPEGIVGSGLHAILPDFPAAGSGPNDPVSDYDASSTPGGRALVPRHLVEMEDALTCTSRRAGEHTRRLLAYNRTRRRQARMRDLLL